MAIGVKHNLKRLEDDLGLYPDEAMQAGIRAMNRTLPTGRRAAIEEFKSLFPGLKVGIMNNQIKLEKANRVRPAAAIEFSAKRFRLFGNLVSRQTRGGIPLRRFPWRIESLDGDTVAPDALRRAFIQRSKRGTVHVWVREGGARYPITALLAASLATTIAEKKMMDQLVAKMHDRFTVVLDREAKFSLHRRT